MRRIVIDASVAVKWVFPDDPAEPNVRQALALLDDIGKGRAEPLQPPHWLAEVAAVASRLGPEVASDAVLLLHAMDFSVAAGPEIYRRAVELSLDLGHHVFDTLYHAVALCSGDAELITADDRYFRKAARRGGISRLAEYGKSAPG